MGFRCNVSHVIGWRMEANMRSSVPSMSINDPGAQITHFIPVTGLFLFCIEPISVRSHTVWRCRSHDSERWCGLQCTMPGWCIREGNQFHDSWARRLTRCVVGMVSPKFLNARDQRLQCCRLSRVDAMRCLWKLIIW